MKQCLPVAILVVAQLLPLSARYVAAEQTSLHPDYQDKRYADGTPVPKMARAFNDYYKRLTRERAGRGLLVECASGYNKWTLNGWYNVADFARDPVTRQRMKMLLDLYWADWAIEQIDGMRGGSRHRCYPGPGSTGGSDGGNGPSWYLFGVGRESTNPALIGPCGSPQVGIYREMLEQLHAHHNFSLHPHGQATWFLPSSYVRVIMAMLLELANLELMSSVRVVRVQPIVSQMGQAAGMLRPANVVFLDVTKETG